MLSQNGSSIVRFTTIEVEFRSCHKLWHEAWLAYHFQAPRWRDERGHATCDSQLLVTRCHESTTEGPSDSLGEKLPITQDIWVHWAQTRFLGVGPPEFIRTFLQDSWAVPIKSCQKGCGGTCSINPASGREAGGAPVVWECSFSTDCKSHWVNCQNLDKFYPNDRKQLHLQLAFLQLQSLLKRRSRRHIQTSVEWCSRLKAGVMRSCWYHVIHFELYEFCSAVLVRFPGAQLDIANQFKG